MLRRTKGWLDDAHLTEIIHHTATPDEALTLSLMADAGCRLREALAFDVSSLSGGLLRIYSTKVRRWRTVPVPARLAACIAAATAHQARFHLPALINLSPRSIQRRLLDICALAGTPPTTPHRLRHSYATRLHAEGVPLPTISALLGHASLAVTLIYLHIGETDYDQARQALDARARRSSPRRPRKRRR